VLLLVLADLGAISAVDKDLARYTFVGGASIYPFAWSVLLAARLEGVAGVLTTLAVRAEAELKALFGIPDAVAVAGLMALGYPTRQPRRLSRRPVDHFATLDAFDGPAFGGPKGTGEP
jgi:nitroreductase